MHPEISEALDAAQDAAAVEIIHYLAKPSTTRVGGRGKEVQVRVEEIEAAVIRHCTSRAGDPHLHLQWNARVKAAGAWRGIHTVGLRDQIETINGIGHAAILANRKFRPTLAAHGFAVDFESGEITQLSSYVGAFSARTGQNRSNVDRYETQWRHEHPGEEPGPKLRQIWARRAWADARPDKIVPTTGAELVDRWNTELRTHIAGKHTDDLVFGGIRNNAPLRVSTFRKTFSNAAAAIGIPDLHPHELRHTAASLAIAAGADVKVVQRMLGHASAAMTLDTYGQLFTDRLDEVSDAIETGRETERRHHGNPTQHDPTNRVPQQLTTESCCRFVASSPHSVSAEEMKKGL